MTPLVASPKRAHIRLTLSDMTACMPYTHADSRQACCTVAEVLGCAGTCAAGHGLAACRSLMGICLAWRPGMP